MNDVQKMVNLFEAHHPCVRVNSAEEDRALLVVRDAGMSLDLDVFQWDAYLGVRNGLVADGKQIEKTEGAIAGLMWAIRRDDRAIYVMLGLGRHLDDPHILRATRELIGRCRNGFGHLVLIDHASRLPEPILAHSTPFGLSLPDEAELEQIVKSTVREFHTHRHVNAKLSRSELDMVVKNMLGLSHRQARQVVLDVIADDRVLDAGDLNHILARKRQLIGEGAALEYVESPASLDDVGGMDNLKKWLRDRERAFDAEAAEFGLRPPRGVLMLGVQGAGKSLCAKAIATAWNRPLLRLDPGSLYDRYVGESERRLRDALQRAEAMAPVVLWIDEIEKGFASAAAQSTDGGLSQRMFGSLLTWMQDHDAPVFLVATANNIEALPPELLRKGRFDEIFFVDLPKTAARKKIFEIHLERRNQEPSGFDLDALVELAEGFSGAEIEQAVISALHGAFTTREKLTTDRLLEAIQSSPPLSVTMGEQVEALRRWADGRCVPAE